MVAPIIINNVIVSPGKSEVIKIPVGRLPSGNQIYIKAHVFHSRRRGPVMLVLGGMHGDEINGVEIVRQAIISRLFSELERGSVIAIPLLNVYGFINFSRDVTDGKDVNRSFPGSASGSLASRIARLLMRKIIPHIDFGIDFHTGGKGLYNYPQIRFSAADPRAFELAKAFGAPYLVEMPIIRKSLRSAVQKSNKTMLVFEGGESLRYDGFSIQKAIEGIERLMVAKKMINKPIALESSILFKKSTWMRASKPGLFLWYKSAGQEIQKGEPIGAISDPFATEEVMLYAPRNGYLIGHNNAPVVNQGDPLFHIGYNARK